MIFRQRRIWSFHVAVLRRTAKKCTKNYNTRAEPLYYSSNLLCRDVAIKALVNEDTLLRTHCYPWCFLGCANWETFVADKMFLNKIRDIFVSGIQILCPQQMLRVRANVGTYVSATMCPRLPGPWDSKLRALELENKKLNHYHFVSRSFIIFELPTILENIIPFVDKLLCSFRKTRSSCCLNKPTQSSNVGLDSKWSATHWNRLGDNWHILPKSKRFCFSWKQICNQSRFFSIH